MSTKTLPDRVRQAIRDSGLTCKEIGQRGGCAGPVVSRFLRGERDVTAATLDRILRGLELTADLRRARD